MSSLLSHRSVAVRVPQTVSGSEPFASYEALTRSLRSACERRSPASALWRRSAEAAVAARQAGACDALVTAALLHRLGDLVPDTRACGAAPLSAVEIAHLGAELLADLYPPLVTEPIRLQPSAQRYLETTTLPMSRSTALAELGWRGPKLAHMTEPERACFERLPFAMNAVKLHRWVLAATGDVGVERELPALLRIAARSVCNDGFGWGA